MRHFNTPLMFRLTLTTGFSGNTAIAAVCLSFLALLLQPVSVQAHYSLNASLSCASLEDNDDDGYDADVDCDDSDPLVNPGATEVCNGIDDDCDGEIDNGLPLFTYYFDLDGDGYGVTEYTITTCESESPLSYYVAIAGDCNDYEGAVNPDAEEVCNGVDDDCNGEADDGLPTYTYYFDADGDGYGSGSFHGSVTTCQTEPPFQYAALDGDCQVYDPLAYPGSDEQCNGLDDNCDGEIDEGLPTYTYYFDADGDGYGDSDFHGSYTTCATEPPFQHGYFDGDCGVYDPAVYPGAEEMCNGYDDDCDGEIDEGFPVYTYYGDIDMDGYGSDFHGTTMTCATEPPYQFAVSNDDCAVYDPNVHPGAVEICNNGIDDDCDGVVDSQCPPPVAVCGVITVYVDPLSPVYDGPGNNNIWWIPGTNLDAGSSTYSFAPVLNVRRHLSQITFDWTTNGACMDVALNGSINNNDKGIVYRDCLPVRNADFNIWRLYQLRIQDEYGSSSCYGTVKVVPQSFTLQSVPVVHAILPPSIGPASEAPEEILRLAELTENRADASEGVAIYPNPGMGSFQLLWHAETEEDVTIRISDMAGQIVSANTYKTGPGENHFVFDMSEHAPGMYVVFVESLHMQQTLKWIKL